MKRMKLSPGFNMTGLMQRESGTIVAVLKNGPYVTAFYNVGTPEEWLKAFNNYTGTYKVERLIDGKFVRVPDDEWPEEGWI